MDRVPADQYSQSDSNSAAQYAPHQEVRPNNYQSGTPTTEYSATPNSARSSTFPQDYLQRQQYTPGSATMAQAQNPSIAQSSPTYPAGPYSPYGPQGHDMSQYPGQPPASYGHWPGYAHHPGMPYSSPGAPPPGGGSPATAGPPRPGQQVYSFVPIPGAQQHKRPRRRYEEIERMYKCGYNGCEKAYGTLNHLNAHVTMQSHGAKRTPEEFKEIRKEWKARKKEEENARKADEERQRALQQQGPGVEGNNTDGTAQTPTSASYPGVRPQLPPMQYNPSGAQQVAAANQYPAGTESMYQQGNGQIYSAYPHSPYQQGSNVYPQQSEAPAYNGAA